MSLPAKSWPRASKDWITWVNKLSPHFQGHWESLGIAQFIKLTKVSVTHNLDLMSTALRFWSKDLNSFIFPFGPTSIMRDISIFIGLPVEGLEVVCLLDVHDPSLLILKFLLLPRLLTHPPYGSGKLLLGYLPPQST